MREKKRFEQRRDALRSSAREKDGKKIALGDVPTRARTRRKKDARLSKVGDRIAPRSGLAGRGHARRGNTRRGRPGGTSACPCGEEGTNGVRRRASRGKSRWGCALARSGKAIDDLLVEIWAHDTRDGESRRGRTITWRRRWATRSWRWPSRSCPRSPRAGARSRSPSRRGKSRPRPARREAPAQESRTTRRGTSSWRHPRIARAALRPGQARARVLERGRGANAGKTRARTERALDTTRSAVARRFASERDTFDKELTSKKRGENREVCPTFSARS